MFGIHKHTHKQKDNVTPNPKQLIFLFYFISSPFGSSVIFAPFHKTFVITLFWLHFWKEFHISPLHMTALLHGTFLITF